MDLVSGKSLLPGSLTVSSLFPHLTAWMEELSGLSQKSIDLFHGGWGPPPCIITLTLGFLSIEYRGHTYPFHKQVITEDICPTLESVCSILRASWKSQLSRHSVTP